MSAPSTIDPTALRRFPRVSADGDVVIHNRGKNVAAKNHIVNISQGGALMLTTAQQEEGATLQVEFGAPIFPSPELLPCHVAHCADAPAEMVERFFPNDGKTRFYQIGLEFKQLNGDQQHLLAAFIKQQLQEERNKRGDQRPTALSRTAKLKPHAPPWSFGLGLLLAGIVAWRGIGEGQTDTDITSHILLALAVSWGAGRIANVVWMTLETWRAPPHDPVASLAGNTLADADTTLADVADDAPLDADAVEAAASSSTSMAVSATSPSSLPSPTEGVSAVQSTAA